MLRRTLGEHVELVTSLAGDLWPGPGRPGPAGAGAGEPRASTPATPCPAGGTLTIDTGNITVDADTIAGGSQARPGHNVRLRVSDTGTGMPAEVIEHAFEPFFTTKRRRRRNRARPGHRLRDPHPGRRRTSGSTQNPARARPSPSRCRSPTEAAAPIAEPAPYQRAPKGETVLVVEDEEALREVTRRIFTRNGYHVITAASGPEALDIARGHPGEIHLLVTDVVMPHMLGKEVAEKMRLIKPGIEVLFMSGYARPVLASQGRLDPERGPGGEAVLRGRPDGHGRAGTQRPLPGVQDHRGRGRPA